MNNFESSLRVIRRNSVQVMLREETYIIHGLSIANLEELKQSITNLLNKIFLKAEGLQKQNWSSGNIQKRGFWAGIFHCQKSLNIPLETLNFVDELLNSILKEPLELLESVSGLPHHLFDPAQPEKCLSIEEIRQLTEVVFEVNGLDFVWTALKQLGRQTIESMQKKPSVPSVSGTDTPSEK